MDEDDGTIIMQVDPKFVMTHKIVKAVLVGVGVFFIGHFYDKQVFEPMLQEQYQKMLSE